MVNRPLILYLLFILNLTAIQEKKQKKKHQSTNERGKGKGADAHWKFGTRQKIRLDKYFMAFWLLKMSWLAKIIV
jgi:hypothetical protein